nr:urease accessory protein UreD [Actibacterium atlanticum]
MLPRVHGAAPEVVFLNTAGGLTGGDQMRFALDLAENARATATTQTAERAYASSGGNAQLNVDLTVGAGAHLDWLPQETILFEDSALTRRTTIALTGDAHLLMVEMVVLGRIAMGEELRRIRFNDLRHVTRDGRPELIEPLQITDDNLLKSASAAGLSHARAFATLALIAPGAEDALETLRSVLPETGAAASGWNGKCVARFMGTDAMPVRKALAKAITTLRGGPLPRVWQL